MKKLKDKSTASLIQKYNELRNRFNVQYYHLKWVLEEYKDPYSINDGLQPWWEEWTEPRNKEDIYEDVIKYRNRVKILTQQMHELKKQIKESQRKFQKEFDSSRNYTNA